MRTSCVRSAPCGGRTSRIAGTFAALATRVEPAVRYPYPVLVSLPGYGDLYAGGVSPRRSQPECGPRCTPVRRREGGRRARRRPRCRHGARADNPAVADRPPSAPHRGAHAMRFPSSQAASHPRPSSSAVLYPHALGSRRRCWRARRHKKSSVTAAPSFRRPIFHMGSNARAGRRPNECLRTRHAARRATSGCIRHQRRVPADSAPPMPRAHRAPFHRSGQPAGHPVGWDDDRAFCQLAVARTDCRAYARQWQRLRADAAGQPGLPAAESRQSGLCRALRRPPACCSASPGRFRRRCRRRVGTSLAARPESLGRRRSGSRERLPGLAPV